MTTRFAGFRGPLRACLVVAAGLVAAGCAGLDSGADGQPRAARKPVPPPSATGVAACFYARHVQNFKVLDRSNLIVYAPNDRNAYHVQISPPSTDLRFADRLAFLPAGERICGFAGERLVVGDARTGPPLSVIAVSRLTPENLASLRALEAGTATPPAEPQPGAGAAIEPAPAPKPDGSAEK